VKNFLRTVVALLVYTNAIDASSLSDQGKTWAYEAALIKLAVAFEHLMLAVLTAAINNDTEQMSKTLSVDFPKHLTDDVCEYILTGGRYFDFKGRDGLLSTIGGFVGKNHYLYVSVKKQGYKAPLEQLFSLRNFAAHESAASKKAVLKALNQQRFRSAGSYLKTQNRFFALSEKLGDLAVDIDTGAPY
jgi:hypothetical protein